jgi:hypothetical protein
MRSLGWSPGLAALCGLLLCALPLLARQEPPPGERAISLVKVGPADVTNVRQVVLQQPVADLFGYAWNYRDKEFYGLLKLRDGGRWYVAASSKSEPGGIFNVESVRFPQAGEFELVVALAERGSLPVGSWVDEAQWRGSALALTQRVSVMVEAPPDAEAGAGEGAPSISILSAADVSLNPREINSVPAGGDVVLQARGLPNSKLYLALRAPYTDLCYVLGPAKRGTTPDSYVIHSASFEVPGDPQQIHFDLIAFASERPVRAGPMSWQSFRLTEAVTSQTIRILVEGRQLRTDSLRVPFIAITRVGQHAFTAESPANRRPEVEQGDAVEVSAYERITESAKLWALTRPKGSNVWLAQGPLLPRGGTSAEAQDGLPVVTWVLPGLRFERPDKKETEGNEFEVLAVLSNAIFPNSWISSGSFSAQPVETLSRPVLVNVNGPTGPSEILLAISRIGGQEAGVDEELTVGSAETVLIERPADFSPAYKIYVGLRADGATTWSFVEAMPNGKGHFIPALSFSNPHAEDGTRYQLVAVATKGPLPTFQAEYQDFLPHVIIASDLINVRYSRAAASASGGWLPSWLSGAQEPATQTAGAQEVTTSMLWLWLLALLALLILFAVLASLLFRSNPSLAGEIADTLQRGHAAAKKRFELPERANPAYALLGFGLLLLIWYIIRNYYLSLYTMIVAAVTGLPQKASAELALWLVVITAFSGIFADIGAKLSKQSAEVRAETDDPKDDDPKDAAREGGAKSGVSVYRLVFLVSLFIAIILWVCQGLIYSAFFEQASAKSTPTLQAVGFGAGLLISMTETITFFLITELSLLPAGWLILFVVLSPLYLLSLVFRFFQRVFEGRRRPQPPRITANNTTIAPQPDGVRPRPPRVVAPAEQKEV